MYTIDQITNENLLYSTGNSTQCSVGTYMGRKSRKRGYMFIHMDFPGGSDGKELACNAEDLGLITGWGRSGEGNSYPLQYSCLENSMDRGVWRATVRGVTKSWTQEQLTYTHVYI